MTYNSNVPSVIVGYGSLHLSLGGLMQGAFLMQVQSGGKWWSW